MNPFSYSRAPDTQAAVNGLAANPSAKLLGGGTNLVDRGHELHARECPT